MPEPLPAPADGRRSPADAPALSDPAAAERQELIERWAERHGVGAARRLAGAKAENLAIAAETIPDNTAFRMRGEVACLTGAGP
ncbi:hypothetical protein [Streptomyces sp. SGAir0957]